MIEMSLKMTSIIDRLYCLLQSFAVLIDVSVRRVARGEQSVIYELYNVDWFVNVWNNSDPGDLTESNHTSRDEIALALFECALVLVGQN